MPNNNLWRDSSDRLTFDLHHISAEDFAAVAKSVISEFALESNEALVIGPDILAMQYRRNTQIIGLDWDNWMGFMVYAATRESESLVREIAAWLSRSKWAAA